MSKMALLVVDAQVGMFQGPKPIYRAEAILGRIARLIEQARVAGVPIVYVQDDDIGGYGTPEWEVHPAIAPKEGDVRIHKLAADSFFESDLQGELEARGVTHLVIAGFKTQFCVDVTARGALSRGYEVTLVADGHSTSDYDHAPASSIIAHHNWILQGMYGANHGFAQDAPGIEVKAAEGIRFYGRNRLDIPRFYDYLVRARRDLWAFLETIPDEVLSREVIPGPRFRSVKDLVLHISVIEDSWLHEDILRDPPVWESTTDLLGALDGPYYADKPLPAVLEYWRRVEKSTLEYLSRLTPGELAREVGVKSSRGEDYFTVEGLLWHVLQHEVRHTAQIALLCRQAGFSPPQLDLLVYLP